MTNVELKNILIHQIAGINDRSVLSAIKTIVDTRSDTLIYKTSLNQQKRIIDGKVQIEKGEYFSNEQAELDIETWLKEK